MTAHTWIEPVCAFYIGVALKGLSHSYDVAGSASRKYQRRLTEEIDSGEHRRLLLDQMERRESGDS